MNSTSFHVRRAFTLVELLVVIAIIGVLVALLLPAVQAAREASRRMQCSNHLKQIGLAMHGYHDTYRVLPYGSGACCAAGNVPAHGGIWPTMILPQLEQQGLYDKIDFNLHTMSLPAAVVQTVVPTYCCPSDSSGASGTRVLRNRFAAHNPATAAGLWYTGSMGPTIPDQCPYSTPTTPSPTNPTCQGWNFGTTAGGGAPAGNGVGMFMRHSTPIRFSDVTDGLANTWMVGETLPHQCAFFSAFAVNFNVSPTTIPLNTMQNSDPAQIGSNWWQRCGFKSKHRGGATFCLGDGSVRFVSQTIDFITYNQIGTRSGGETAAVP